MMEEPKLKVGIVSGTEIKFSLRGDFELNGKVVTGDHVARIDDGKVVIDGVKSDNYLFTPLTESSLFELHDVIIGVDFHWERRETQVFKGSLSLIVEGDKLTAVNILPLEDYLCSVISSEMSATASLELLKAHAVISRSWLLAQIEKRERLAGQHGDAHDTCCGDECGCHADDNELIKWFDREDHTNFDVCADDHCQRYQGVTRQTTPTVAEAVAATRGEVLMYQGELCDARFSKCCGGVFERFDTCWESVDHHYLQPRRDGQDVNDFPDLSIERNAEEWILSQPAAYCNTDSAEILGQVLNNYDQETKDFYRWKVTYTQKEISELIHSRLGIDFGQIINLVPVSRGTSGRLWKLEVVGTKRTLVIGKELIIRRALSKSHLYSSAFVVERTDIDADGIPGSFTLHGAGWGHGVGLCQIGAAVMGANGFGYHEILSHYFIDSECTRLY